MVNTMYAESFAESLARASRQRYAVSSDSRGETPDFLPGGLTAIAESIVTACFLTRYIWSGLRPSRSATGPAGAGALRRPPAGVPPAGDLSIEFGGCAPRLA